MDSKATVWTARVMMAVAVLFLIVDGGMKLFNPAPVVDASVHLGIPLALNPRIGVLELVLVAIYLIPQTSVLGVVLWTAYLGGATAIQVRIGEGWFPVLFPSFIALLLWGALWLRDEALRKRIPIRN